MNLSQWMSIYVFTYSLLVLITFILVFYKRKEFNFLTESYFKFLFTKERFLIYVLGTVSLLIPAHYLDIHSWDYSIAIFQPILAYLTAPWSVEVLCKLEKGCGKVSESFVAFCLILFTGSWSVEMYLLFRDGYYMPDWIINIPIGIACYLIIGTLLNVDWNSKSA